MIAFNHALTGALIGLTVQRPLIALPAALLSHFVVDMIPHHGREADTASIGSRGFRTQLLLDATACFLLVLVLAIVAPYGWLLAAACAFLATAPDFAWMPGYLRVRRGGAFTAHRPNRFMRFAASIQWFERPIGALVEIAWAVGMIILLSIYR